MDVNECLEKGLLKKETPDKRKADKSIEVAVYKLERARKLLELGMFEETILNGYAALFHAGRAILFRDGIREKSHYALFVYLKEKYSDKLERRFLNELNSYRLERHDISYGLEKPQIGKEEAEHIVEAAKNFINATKKMIA
ncbi:MAG: HEPN domain-containing protein [Nanoarchaeota archaeon]